MTFAIVLLIGFFIWVIIGIFSSNKRNFQKILLCFLAAVIILPVGISIIRDIFPVGEADKQSSTVSPAPAPNNYSWLQPDPWAEDDLSDEVFLGDCPKCKHGECPDCGGSMKSNLDGVLGAFGCALCDRTGDCYYCGGDGYIEIY